MTKYNLSPPGLRTGQWTVDCGLPARRSLGAGGWSLDCAAFLHRFCTISASLFAPCFSQSSLYQPLPHFQFPDGAILLHARISTKGALISPIYTPRWPPCLKATAASDFCFLLSPFCFPLSAFLLE